MSIIYRHCPACGVEYLPGNNWPHGPSFDFVKPRNDDYRQAQCNECDVEWIVTKEDACATIRYLDGRTPPKPAADKLLCPNCGADHSIWGGSIKCGKCQKFFPDSWPPGYWPKPDRRGGISDEIKLLCPGCSRENDNKGRIMDGHQYCSRCAPKPDRRAELRAKYFLCSSVTPDKGETAFEAVLADIKYVLNVLDTLEAKHNELLDMLEMQPKERDEVLLALTAELTTRQSSIERLKAELAKKNVRVDKYINDYRSLIHETNNKAGKLIDEITILKAELKAKDSEKVCLRGQIAGHEELYQRQHAKVKQLKAALEQEGEPIPLEALQGEYHQMRIFENWLRCKILDAEDEIKRREPITPTEDK